MNDDDDDEATSKLIDSNLQDTSDLYSSLLQNKYMDEFDESQFIKKLFIFKKQDIPANETESKLSLAQIIKNLNKDPQSGIDDAESANAADTDTSAASTAAAYAPPYPVGIRLALVPSGTLRERYRTSHLQSDRSPTSPKSNFQ